jgi:NAD(P)-dependent dehydrogenase (short-subunit alcohol dehydrogenase family)
MTIPELESQLTTNFYGVVYVMRAVLPVMRKQRSGHIINLSSMAGVIGFRHCAAYAASKFAVEGLSQSVAAEVERFGIHITLVEPGFFRTDLLDERNVRWPKNAIADYASERSPRQEWSTYNGTQQGDPAKLGEALVTIANMKNPPNQFYAGSDAVAGITPALQARLQEIRDYEELSKSTDGSF